MFVVDTSVSPVPVFKVIAVPGEYQSLQVDLSTRFTNDYPECDIRSFSLETVEVKDTGVEVADYQSLYSFDPQTGVLVFERLNIETERQLLYFSASTRFKKSEVLPIVEVELKYSETFQNYAPFFKADLESLKVEVSQNDTESTVYGLPEVFDPNGDQVSLEVSGLENFMKIEDYQLTVEHEGAEAGNYTLAITLSDPFGAEREYTVDIEVAFILEENSTESSSSNSTFEWTLKQQETGNKTEED